jgi:hypothetical protein
MNTTVGKGLITHSGAARWRGVCTKTIDRWVEKGILARPEYVNGRKYHHVENIERVGQIRSPIEMAPEAVLKLTGAAEALHRPRLERKASESEKPRPLELKAGTPGEGSG